MDHDLPAAERRRRSIQMLREVLDGEPYATVSARWGISPSSVERRVKACAVHLTRSVGVEGLHDKGAMFVHRLRGHREAILAALEHFDAARAVASRRAARVLSTHEVELGALRVRARSPRSAHDLALYHLMFATGLRPLEVARLKLGDYLLADGAVRTESVVRAEVAIQGRERPLFFLHRQLDLALDAYLLERATLSQGLGHDARWRGLDPEGPLFLAVTGEPYAITPYGHAGQSRFVCRSLLEAYRRVFRLADVPGLSTQSARLTLMSRMYERGADEDQVGLVLGIADRSAVREQLPRPRPDLAKVLAEPV